MTKINPRNFSEPSDLPPASRKAWREVTDAVKELQGALNGVDVRVGNAFGATEVVARSVESVVNQVAQQGTDLDSIKEVYVPTEPIRKPSTPILTTGSGTITVTWDGNLLEINEEGSGEDVNPTYGTPVPFPAKDNKGFSYVYIEWSSTGLPDPPSPDDDTPQVKTWTPVGSPMTEKGSFTEQVFAGTVRYYRLVAVNNLGVESAPSEVASITSMGTSLTDLEQDVIDALTEIENTANQALSSSDGKVTISPNAPVDADGADKPIGAIWWQKTAGNVVGMWEWTGTAPWQARKYGAAVLGQVDIGTGTSGSLSGARLDVNSVTIKSLAVSDFTSLTQGGEFDTAADLANWTGAPASWYTISTTETDGSLGSLRVQGPVPGGVVTLTSYVKVTPGETLRFSWNQLNNPDYNGTSGNGKLRIGSVTSESGSGTLLEAWQWPLNTTSWTAQSRAFDVPLGVGMIAVTLSFDHSAGTIIIDSFKTRRMNAGELIVDGSITGLALKGDAIDGKTITGATMRTAASGARLQFDSFGIRAFNSSNAVTATLFSESGGIRLNGNLWLGSASHPGSLSATYLSLGQTNSTQMLMSHNTNGNASSELSITTSTPVANKGQANIKLYTAANSDSLPTHISMQGELRPGTINQQGMFAQNKLNKLTVDTGNTSDDIFSGSDLTTDNYALAVGPNANNRILFSGWGRKIQAVNSGGGAGTLGLNPAGGDVSVGNGMLVGPRGRLYTSASRTTRTDANIVWTRIARVDGGAGSSGAYIQGMLYGGGNYGTNQKYSALVHFGQRGDNSAAVDIWEYGLSSLNNNAPSWRTVQVSTYVFDLWLGLPGYGESFDFVPGSMINATAYDHYFTTTTNPGGTTANITVHPEPGTVYTSQTHTTTQSIPTNLWTSVVFNNLTAQGRAGINTSSTTVTLIEAGLYSLTGSLAYATLGSVSGRRIIRFGDSNSSNAGVVQQFEQPPFAGSRNIINMSMTRYFNAGQVLSLQTYQNQGTSLDLGTDAGENYFHVVRVG